MCRVRRFFFWIWTKIMRKHVNGDVRLIGMVAGTHVIEDIGRDVPYGETVIIPAELALRSVDLWRAISQRCVFRIPASLVTAAPHGIDPEQNNKLSQYAIELESKLVRLQAENEGLRARLEEPNPPADLGLGEKLDSILAAIQASPKVVHVHSDGAHRSGSPKEERVDGTAPTFLPSEITMKDMDARIDIQGEKSQSSAVSEASKALSKLRKGR